MERGFDMKDSKFHRQGNKFLKRVKNKWRRPKGRQSKMRKHEKGKSRLVCVGCRSPKNERGMHPSGFKEKMVYNLMDLKDVNGKAIRISGTVGNKKKIDIVTKARELKIKILNWKV